ncbi:MAG: hypothetical protein J3K34DRAFT_148694 [Monoraphidium minutum]|nr:MAG: hypothetical protein J3K34DRAFT_148694 [Monoraphidium minutum]
MPVYMWMSGDCRDTARGPAPAGPREPPDPEARRKRGPHPSAAPTNATAPPAGAGAARKRRPQAPPAGAARRRRLEGSPRGVAAGGVPLAAAAPPSPPRLARHGPAPRNDLWQPLTPRLGTRAPQRGPRPARATRGAHPGLPAAATPITPCGSGPQGRAFPENAPHAHLKTEWTQPHRGAPAPVWPAP